MSKEAMKLALEAAYLAGFNASGEGYNGEYPFQDHNAHPAQDEGWCQNRDNALRKALADQPAPMIRGDIRDGLVDDEPAQSSKPFDTHAAPGQSFDTHSRTPQQEPVGKKTRIGLVTSAGWDSLPVGTELYTTPQAQPAQQQQQEPVAWRVKVETKLRDGSVDFGYQLRNERLSKYDEPLYTSPPASKPLTDEQYFEIGQRHWLPSIKVEKIHKEIIEAAHGIKGDA